VPVHKKGDKTDNSNYNEISLLSTSYKIPSSILLSWLSPYLHEIIGNDQHEFHLNNSFTDRICLHSSGTEEKKSMLRQYITYLLLLPN
jgi:hypothetical protein